MTFNTQKTPYDREIDALYTIFAYTLNAKGLDDDTLVDEVLYFFQSIEDLEVEEIIDSFFNRGGTLRELERQKLMAVYALFNAQVMGEELQ